MSKWKRMTEKKPKAGKYVKFLYTDDFLSKEYEAYIGYTDPDSVIIGDEFVIPFNEISHWKYIKTEVPVWIRGDYAHRTYLDGLRKKDNPILVSPEELKEQRNKRGKK